jgi:Ca2+-binding RTX toxin-like protein
VGTNNLSLTGADAGSFEISGSELYLKAGTTLDFATQSSYDVTVEVDDTTVGATPDGTTAYSLGITEVGVNAAPTAVNLNNTTTSLPENTNTTSALKVADIAITDDGVGTNNLSLTDADAGSFEISGSDAGSDTGSDAGSDAGSDTGSDSGGNSNDILIPVAPAPTSQILPFTFSLGTDTGTTSDAGTEIDTETDTETDAETVAEPEILGANEFQANNSQPNNSFFSRNLSDFDRTSPVNPFDRTSPVNPFDPSVNSPYSNYGYNPFNSRYSNLGYNSYGDYDYNPLNLRINTFTNRQTGSVLQTIGKLEKEVVKQNPNYESQGVLAIAADPNDPDAVPVYRFYNSFRDTHIFTTSQAEAEALRRFAIFKDEGVAFHAYNEQKEGTIPVHRVYNPQTGTHTFTSSLEEREELIAEGYNDEGVAYYAQDTEELKQGLSGLFRDLANKVAAVEEADTEESPLTPPSEGAEDNTQETDVLSGETVSTFTSTATGDVVLTTDEAEKAALENNPGFEQEDTSFASANESDPDAEKVNRFYNPTTGDHLFTVSEAEAEALRNDPLYQEEEADLYAYTEPKAGTSLIDRVYDSDTGIHIFTSSQEKRDQLIAEGYNDEGVGYYLPTDVSIDLSSDDLLNRATNLANRVVAAGVTVDTEAFLDAVDTAVDAGGAETVREVLDELEGQLDNADNALAANSGFDLGLSYSVASNKALVDILGIGVASILPEGITSGSTSLSETFTTLADRPDIAVDNLPTGAIDDLAEWDESWSTFNSEKVDSSTGNPIYGFTNQEGSVFLTSSEEERDSVKDNLTGFDYRGVALISANPDDPNAKPVYRFYNQEAGFHGFTLDDVSSNLASGYRDEDIGFYAYDQPQAGTVEIVSLFDQNQEIMVYGSAKQIDAAVEAGGFADREAYYEASGWEFVSSFHVLDNPGDNTFVADDAVVALSGGKDTVTGGVGGDSLQGNRGNEIPTGGVGDDYILGDASDNTLDGFGGNDVLFGGLGSDNLNGGPGNDTLVGGLGSDNLNGDSGNDTLDGGKGSDNLDGGTGDDFLSGDRGNDVLTGGAGADDFFFSFSSDGSYGTDTITDFNSAEGDKIVLDSETFTLFALGDLSPDDFAIVENFNLIDHGNSPAKIIYDPANGSVYYNPTQGVGDEAMFAQLTNSPNLSSADFIIGSYVEISWSDFFAV